MTRTPYAFFQVVDTVLLKSFLRGEQVVTPRCFLDGNPGSPAGQLMDQFPQEIGRLVIPAMCFFQVRFA